ncbi:hypothetical protein U9M48_012467 [Paspalum notatum var. saurae]|uniref:HMA domain-containing protein n=1 Tax=Paspalum notatum var. saurae TaxID=547442 RepID=A0AAQ3SZM3_PASNO
MTDPQDKAAGGNGKMSGGDAPAAAAAAAGEEEEVVIGVPVHCDGCARKLRRALQQRLDQGVGGDVAVDSRTNRVVLRGRGAAENAADAVQIVQWKTGEKAVLLSPASPAPAPEKGAKKLDAADDGGANKGGAAADDELPEMDMKMATVLRINLHCDACCEEIKRRILKITGVEEAVPHLKSSQMLVKGMVEPATLVGFIHKCTGRKSGILRAEPLPDLLPASNSPPPAMAAEAETNKKDEAPPAAAENSSPSEKKKNGGGGGENEEKKGGGAEEEDDDSAAGDKNPKAAEEKETSHGGEGEAPAGNAAGDGDGDGGLVVENRTTKDDRLFTVPMPAGVVTVAPEAALKNAVDPYYYYPPPNYAYYYAHQYPYQYRYQYPQPYPAYACGGPAMSGYPHPQYPSEAFSEENPNACAIV